MKILRGLLAVTLILATFGMGILSFANAPLLQDSDLPDAAQSEDSDRGTRGVPPEQPYHINLYFYTDNEDIMNTTVPWVTSASLTATEITFSLEYALQSSLLVKDDVGAYGMEAVVYLSGGNAQVHIEVFDDSESTLVGEATSGTFTATPGDPERTQTRVTFESPPKYEFPQGNKILVRLTATGDLAPTIHYGRTIADSHINLYCLSMADVSVNTRNFNDFPTDIFYPYDITFPENHNRRQVIIRGTVNDAFGDYDVEYVTLEIQPPSGPAIERNATWVEETASFNYTWLYSGGAQKGEYNVTAHVYDRQNNVYTYFHIFEMAQYGVLLTSPHQVDGEGFPNSVAKRNVVQNSTVTYLINVRNIGYDDTTMKISVSSPSTDWIYRLESENLTLSGNKEGDMDNLTAGQWKGIKLTVDSTGQDLKEQVKIYVSAQCEDDEDEDADLQTTTTVKVKYELRMEFPGGQTSAEQTVEMGDYVEYLFTVFNTGGADDTIWFEISAPPAQWDTELIGAEYSPSLGDHVEIKSGKSKELTLKVTTPSSGGDETAIIDITGKSLGSFNQQDPEVVSDTITTTTIKTSGLKLELLDPPEKDADPEEQIDFEFRLTNTGTSLANFSVLYTSLGSGWSISLSDQFFTLSGGNSQTFNLYVEPSSEVIAENYTIPVTATNIDDISRTAQKKVYCIVNEIPSIELIEPDPSDPVLYGETEPGKDVTYIIKIKNTGNVPLTVDIVLMDRPSDWTVDFGNASSTWSEYMEPQQEEEITLIFKVPDDAEGDETVDISVEVDPDQGDSILIETHTKIKAVWFQPLLMLLVPILLFVVIVVMVIVIYRRR